MSTRALLDDREQRVMDNILGALRGIQDLGLVSNEAELAQAVHVLQGFVIQHMLGRIEPEVWGHWFVDAIASEAASPPPLGGANREGGRGTGEGPGVGAVGLPNRADANAAPPDRATPDWQDANAAQPSRARPDWRARAVAHAQAVVDLVTRPLLEDALEDMWLGDAQATLGLDMTFEPRYAGVQALGPDGKAPEN